jgi:hypothetical protein
MAFIGFGVFTLLTKAEERKDRITERAKKMEKTMVTKN